MASRDDGFHHGASPESRVQTVGSLEDFFTDTLRRQSARPLDSARRWVGAPFGLAAHSLVVLVLGFFALYAPSPPEAPLASRLPLLFAPPPPPPLRSGTALAVEADRASAISVSTAVRPRFVPSTSPIPSSVLSPSFGLQLGDEEGFDDGVLFGMRSGIPGGVQGGVPGGLVGGAVGGTGDSLPQLPRPDVGPRPIRMPQPRYTKTAIKDNVRGEVVLRVIINERGKVEVLKVLRSIPGLDEEAIRVVTTSWRFHPATKNGRPVPALSDLRVQFNLY